MPSASPCVPDCGGSAGVRPADVPRAGQMDRSRAIDRSAPWPSPPGRAHWHPVGMSGNGNTSTAARIGLEVLGWLLLAAGVAALILPGPGLLLLALGLWV